MGAVPLTFWRWHGGAEGDTPSTVFNWQTMTHCGYNMLLQTVRQHLLNKSGSTSSVLGGQSSAQPGDYPALTHIIQVINQPGVTMECKHAFK